MIPRLTLEYVQQQFENEGYVLLSPEYINNRTKLDFICPRGHTHSIAWNHWYRGNRCSWCSGKIPKTIETVRSAFQEEGYILLTSEYINNAGILDYICPEGHKHNTIWRRWQRGDRCPFCYGNVRKTIEEVKQSFKENGYILLTTEYVNAHQKLYYICPKGHKHYITWNNWYRGKRCPTCYSINCFGENTPNWKGGISAEPYCSLWLDTEYKESLKERDGYTCLNPLCKRISETLFLHHIDYDKKNCHPMNLITLCHSCNSLANFHREWHAAWYQRILQIRYGY